jgi:hypothetical protein
MLHIIIKKCQIKVNKNYIRVFQTQKKQQAPLSCYFNHDPKSINVVNVSIEQNTYVSQNDTKRQKSKKSRGKKYKQKTTDNKPIVFMH